MTSSRATSVLLLLGVLLIAANLRPTLLSVGPLLPMIRASEGLSASGAGVLNALPLVAFAGTSILVPRAGRRLGIERALLVALVVLAVGTVLRSLPSLGALFGGTVVLCIGIAGANVLLPSLIKRDFPARVSVMTAFYGATMTIVSALAAGVAVPLASVLPGGWRGSLACWVVLTAVAIAVWAVAASRRPARTAGVDATSTLGIPWRSALAWQVTVFMGLQAFAFYVLVGWLPTLLHSYGMSDERAGLMLLLSQCVSVVTYLLSPLAIRHFSDQRLVAASTALLQACGWLGLMLAPGLAVLWVVVLGVALSVSMVLALSFFSLRAADPHGAAALSGMGQSLGYLLAAGGPAIFGVLGEVTGGWTVPLVIVTGIAVGLATTGLFAGRDRQVTGR